MENDVYYENSHNEMRDAVAALAESCGCITLKEQRLPNGRIADLLILGAGDEIEIIEVKTIYKDEYLQTTYEKYARYCNRLILCVPFVPLTASVGSGWPTNWTSRYDQVGVYQLSRHGLTIHKPAATRTIRPLDLIAMTSLLPTD